MATRVAVQAETTRTVDVTALELRAEVAPDTVNEEDRTVEIVWTTGARVLRASWDIGSFWEELSLDPKHVRMDRINTGAAPLLNTHGQWDLRDVIGVVESGRLEKKRGVATVRFAKAEDDPEADKIFRKVKDRIIRNVSVGYRVHKMEKVEDGADKIPVYSVTDWTPYEVSFVPIGADAGAMARSSASERNQCVIVTRQEMKMNDDDPKTPSVPAPAPVDPAVAATRAVTLATIEAKKAEAERIALERENAKAEERLRAAEIEKIGDQSGLGREWSRTQIELGTTVEKARQLAFEQMVAAEQPIDGSLRIGSGDDQRDKFVRGCSAWLFERTGTTALIQAAKTKKPDLFKDVTLDGGEFRGYSPLELARLSLENDRVNTRGMDPLRIVQRAFTHLSRSANYQTLADFPNIVENVLGKVLLGSYIMQANTWERFCGTADLADFRPSNRYRTGSLDSLDVIPEHGEYKSGVIPDAAKYALSTQRMGKMFSISEEVIVNDDMGALVQMAMELGKAGMRSIENAVYALLALNSGLGPTQGDGQPFFHANRANVNATGSAISVAGIDADRVVMRAQKDPNGKDFIDLSPAVLLVPDSLVGTAKVINDAQYDPDTANKLQRPNMVRGLFRDVVGSPRLAAASTRRYLFADPNDAAAIVVAFLAGKGRAPVMESKTGWRVDGTEWKVSLYAKAQMGDAKAAVTNAGQ